MTCSLLNYVTKLHSFFLHCAGSLLSLFNVSQKSHLNNSQHRLHTLIVILLKEVRRYRQKNESLKERVQRAERFWESGYLDTFQNMSEPAKKFLCCQLRNSNNSKHRRNYSIDDKLFGLTLLKRNAASYRYLSQIFCSPSVESLRKMSSEIPLEPGLCDVVFDCLEEEAKKRKDPSDRLCMLMCDDVEIDIQILFKEKKGEVEGFVDDGIKRTRQIADHATVWMLKEVNPNSKSKPFTQPLVYTFCKGNTSSESLKNMYKEVVRRIHKTGFIVIASVCDQEATNDSAIKQLIKESTAETASKSDECVNTIVVDGHEIIQLFDPPHLLKCIRNNLLTKDLEFVWQGTKRIAS